MDLKDLINFGYNYYLDDENKIKLIIKQDEKEQILNTEDNLDDEQINIIKENNEFFKDEKIQKKWFFLFFNNNKYIHDEDYNNELSQSLEVELEFEKTKINIFNKDIQNKIKKIDDEDINNNEVKILKLIKEKSKHFFPKIILFNKRKINESIEKSELIFLIPDFNILEDIIINNKNEKLIEYFENDENFNFNYTYNDFDNIDYFFKNLKKKTLISNILEKLRFRTYNKVIYFNEHNYDEKLDENKLKNFKNDFYVNRVITYYNTIRFILYETVENWLKHQKISKNFKRQNNLKNYLNKIIFYENTMNMFFRFEDLKKRKLMLNLFMKNKFSITDNIFIFQKYDFKEIYNIINDYIYCEINNEELHFKNKYLLKNLNDSKKYILSKILKNQNNNDLYLLNSYIMNPKKNEYIILGLLNKYKNIL